MFCAVFVTSAVLGRVQYYTGIVSEMLVDATRIDYCTYT